MSSLYEALWSKSGQKTCVFGLTLIYFTPDKSFVFSAFPTAFNGISYSSRHHYKTLRFYDNSWKIN